MNREEQIKSKYGQENHFRVPEGYFDSFATQLMDKLPEREPVVMARRSTLSRPIVRWLYAAACVCVLVVMSIVYVGQRDLHPSQAAVEAQQSFAQAVADYTYEDIADYVMMDNDDIYAYLADASYD